MITIISYSQDKIVTHRGDTITCNIIELADKMIRYKLVGEDSLKRIPKSLTKEIIFENGIAQEVTDKIIINGIADWKKVQMTTSKSDIEGLVRYGEIIAKSNSTWSTTDINKMEDKATDRIRKTAAKNGCHIILITDSTTGDYGDFEDGSNASITGIAYKY